MRLTLDILEATALLSAVKTEETALHLSMATHRRKNALTDLADVACSYADLASAKRKLQSALASETQTRTSSGPATPSS